MDKHLVIIAKALASKHWADDLCLPHNHPTVLAMVEKDHARFLDTANTVFNLAKRVIDEGG